MASKKINNQRLSIIPILVIVASCLLFVGLVITTYFLVKQSFDINTLKTNKADQNTVYDRTTVDQKIPSSGGIPGPSGPKGDPGSIGVELLITNDYSFTKFAQISDYTPVNLLFPSDFTLSQYAQTTFIGWVISSFNQDKMLIGKLYDLTTNQFLANYQLSTSLASINGATNDKIAWNFQKVLHDELFPNYYNKIDLTKKLNEKIAKDNTYSKAETDLKINQKIDTTTVYSKTEIDTKFADLSSVTDHYTKSQFDSQLATKADITDTYLKSYFDTQLATKVDKTTIYDKTDISSKLALKIDKSSSYSKAELDQKFLQIKSLSFKVVKDSQDPTTGKVTTKLYRDSVISNEHSPFFSGNPQNMLHFDNFPFFKGDRLVIKGKIQSNHGNNFQGPVFILEEKWTNRAPTIKSIRHWNRWMDTATAQMRTESHQPASSAGTNLPLAEYPLFIAHNLFYNYYQFRLEFFFGENHIFVYGHGILNNQNDVNDTYSVAILNYPPNYNLKNGIYLTKIMNVKADKQTGKKISSSQSSFGVGTEFIITPLPSKSIAASLMYPHQERISGYEIIH